VSGEFGDYQGGYFHTKIENAAADLTGGSGALTRLWAPVLEAFTPVARAISWHEASDSDESYPIEATIEHMDAIKAALKRVEDHVAVYRRVRDNAIRDYMKNTA
jgi:hypothetical protein